MGISPVTSPVHPSTPALFPFLITFFTPERSSERRDKAQVKHGEDGDVTEWYHS
jgi:hypothetical protein